MDQNDEELMLAFQAGEHEGVRVIYQRYKNRIFNFSLRFLGNRADAEDTTAEVFLALFSKKYSFNPEAKFSTWLFTIARNNCISRLRKQKKSVSLWFQNNSESKEIQWDIPDPDEGSRETLSKKEAAAHVREALLKLPAEQREAVILREYQRFSYQEISRILQCSLEKVKILIYRGREQLKLDLAAFMKEGEDD